MGRARALRIVDPRAMDPKRPSFSRLLPILLAILVSGGCGGRTEVPVEMPGPASVYVALGQGTGALLPEPHVRYPAGTRLVAHEGEAEVPFAEGFFAVGGPAPTLDGDGLLFLVREDPETPYAVWISRPFPAPPRLLLRHPGEAGAVAELPDGRLVYAGTIEGQPVVPGMRYRWALFVADARGAEARRITFGAGADVDPIVLPDGRILYASWQPDAGFLLWTVHPDGTGAARLPGAHGGVPFAVEPYLVDASTLRYRARGPDVDAGVRQVDLRAPGAGSTPVPTDAHAAERLRVLASRQVQGHLSLVKPELAFGTLLGIDPRREHERARALRVRRYPDGARLGDVPLADDGSFFVRVPADMPLVFDLVDELGAGIATQSTPIWVRPNEVRACVSCHHDRQTAPPNRRPLAVLSDPVTLEHPDAGGEDER